MWPAGFPALVLRIPDGRSPNCQTRETIRAPPAPRRDVSVNVALCEPARLVTVKRAAGGDGTGADAPRYQAAP
jgi:hypothetical protein